MTFNKVARDLLAGRSLGRGRAIIGVPASPLVRRAIEDRKRLTGRPSGLSPSDRAALERVRDCLYADMARDQLRRSGEILERLDAQERARRWYSETAVPAALEQGALAMAKVCAHELGVEVPEVMFFSPESEGEKRYAEEYGRRDWPAIFSENDILGLCERDARVIWVRAHLPFIQTMRVVAHESAHLLGPRRGDEAAAQAYEQSWETRLPRAN